VQILLSLAPPQHNALGFVARNLSLVMGFLIGRHSMTFKESFDKDFDDGNDE
jgi:hypothetical protein